MRRCCLLSVCLSAIAACAADPPLRWWKGNLHTHSLWSDGDDYPEMVVAWYKQHGYHFLALSDHNILSDHERWVSIAGNRGGARAFSKYLAQFGEPWVEQRDTPTGEEVRLKTLSEFRIPFEEADKFLLIQSEEISGIFMSAPIHVNATNIQEEIEPPFGRSVTEVLQKMINSVVEQRRRTGVPMIPHINHPNFGWGLTAEELMPIESEQFFEVYNGHPQVHNEGDALHASTERVWDIILTERIAHLGKGPLFGLATDDAHHYHGDSNNKALPGRGWVCVRAVSLTAESLIAALEAGDFYASSGVTLKEVRRTKAELAIEIEPQPGIEYTTDFIGTRTGYDRTSAPIFAENGNTMRVTRQYSSEIGETLMTVTGPIAAYALGGDEIYVRAHVRSSKLKENPYREGEFEQAWTQPLVTDVR